MKHSSDPFISFIIDKRWYVLVGVVLLTVGFGLFIPKITVNNDPTQNIPENLPSYQTYKALQDAFPSPRKLLLMARFTDSSLPLAAKVELLGQWSERFDAIEGIDNIMHLGSLRVPMKGGLLGITADFVVPQNKALSDSMLRLRIMESSDFTSAFISSDESVLGMMMSVDDSKNQVRVIAQTVELQKKLNTEGKAEIIMAGAPLYAFSIDQAMRRDFMILLPACLLVVFVLLWRVFHRASYVIAALGVTAIALVWTFGLMGITATPFSVVTSMIPVILFPIGVASAIHVFKTYARNSLRYADIDKRKRILMTFGELTKPIMLSAITTFAGFISFAPSRVAWTRIFGIYTAIGVALALLFSVVLLPLALYYSSDDKYLRKLAIKDQKKQSRGHKEWLWWKVYTGFTQSSYQWVILSVLIALIGVFGYLRVAVEGNPIGFFPPGSEVRRSDQLIESFLGGTRFIHIVVESPGKPITTREQWEEIDQISAHVNSMDMVGGTSSLLLLVKSVSGLMGSSQAIAEPALAMVLGGRSMLGKKFEQFVEAWISPDRHRTKISLICKNVTGTRYKALTEEIKSYIESTYPQYRAIVSGPPVLNDAMTGLLVQTQWQSLVFAFVSVFLVLCLVFRSAKTGLFAVFPIILSTAFVYALMGVLGVAVNAVTIITVNTCIGIGIDYSIHFVSGYLYLMRQSVPRSQAIVRTVKTRGSVIIGNTLVVGIGFLVLAFSTFPPIRHFGLFVCISMVTSSVFALLFLPALLQNYGAKVAKTTEAE